MVTQSKFPHCGIEYIKKGHLSFHSTSARDREVQVAQVISKGDNVVSQQSIYLYIQAQTTTDQAFVAGDTCSDRKKT